MNRAVSYCGGIVRMLSDNLVYNPVVTRELRTRMRGWRAFLLMGGYVILLGIVALISYAAFAAMSRFQYGSGVENQRVGLQLLSSITWTQAILLVLIIPALSARALTSELESKTIELLVLTRLSAGRIVVGKLLAGFLYSMMLLLCSLPIAGICVMLGGISPTETITVYMLLVAWAFLLTAISVFWSALFSKTAVSSLFAYGTSGAYMMFTSIIASMFAYGGSSMGSDSVPTFSALSPVWAAYVVGHTATVCGLKLSVTAIAFWFHAAVGALLLLVASMHVRYKKADRSPAVRLLLIGISAAAYWLILGDKFLLWSGMPTPKDIRSMIAIALLTVLVALGYALPIFTTGPIRKKAYSWTYGLRLSKALRGDLGGSMMFMMLWAAVLCAVIMVTVAWASAAYPISGPALAKHIPSVRVWAVAGYAWLTLTFVVLAVLAGLSAIGIAASAIASKKGEAVAMSVLAYIACMGVYGGILASYRYGASNLRNPMWQLGALWPPLPFNTVADGSLSSAPPFLWRVWQSWIVVGTAYTIITVLALSAASLILKKRSGIQE